MYRIGMLFVAVVVVVAAGCQAGLQRTDDSPATSVVPSHCEGRMIPLEEAQRLITGCEVRALGQPHEGPVILYLRNDATVCFFQPRLDWVIGEANRVCRDSPIQMTIQ